MDGIKESSGTNGTTTITTTRLWWTEETVRKVGMRSQWFGSHGEQRSSKDVLLTSSQFGDDVQDGSGRIQQQRSQRTTRKRYFSINEGEEEETI